MSKLSIGIDIRDFDLDRVGFSLAVLDEHSSRQMSEAYMRMTLIEMDAFLKALKADAEKIQITTYDGKGVNKLPPLKGLGPREVEPAKPKAQKLLAAE